MVGTRDDDQHSRHLGLSLDMCTLEGRCQNRYGS